MWHMFLICSIAHCMVQPMRSRTGLPPPFLRVIELQPERVAPEVFPFTLPILARGELRIELERPITLLVGENGSGKSTLLEAIAAHCGFRAEGGSSDHTAISVLSQTRGDTARTLAAAFRFAWKPRVTRGFFFRAETLFALARRVDLVNWEEGYEPVTGARGIDQMSHGEGFIALFANRFGSNSNCIYLMDEPEAALSPERQLAFLAIMHRWHRSGRVQAIIATHAPMLMAYPEAAILSLDGGSVSPVSFLETNHYRRMKSFLDAPERYVRALLAGVEAEDRGDQGDLPSDR